MVFRRLWVSSVLSVCVLSAGCATVSPPLTDAEFMRQMEVSSLAVEGLLAESQRDQAVALLRQIAATAPERTEPWSRLARLYFDAGDYGSAIVAADEVLKRMPGDKQALSLRAVGGLRVATSALVALQGDAEMTGSARTDAGKLAKVLRESLGEEVLVPPVAALTPKGGRVATPAAGRRTKSSAVSAGQLAPRSVGRSPTVNGDPFSILK